jgi:hypothetical protein
MNKKVMMIRYDGGTPRQLTDNNKKLVEMYVDENKLPVYISEDLELIGNLCLSNKDRYRLYRSQPFKTRFLNPATGGFAWVDVVPWSYRKDVIDTGKNDKENGEVIFESKITFYEDPTGKEAVEPTEDFITGRKPKSTISLEEQLFNSQKKNAEYSETIKGLTSTVEDLVKKVDDLSGQVSLVKKEKAKA